MKMELPKIKIALFCGGRGSATIIRELLRWPQVELSLLVNAYDDGLSTGALRNAITNMLGPSDFRKNLSYLIDPFSESQYALKNLFEYRLAKDTTSLTAVTLLDQTKLFLSQLNQEIASKIKNWLACFFSYVQSTNLSVEYADCALGNLIFAGAYLAHEQNFNAATCAIAELAASRARLINVSKGENRILMAIKENGEILTSEEQIVAPQSLAPIKNLFFIPNKIDKPINIDETWLAQHEKLPEISPEAELALQQADIIIYGPGTQHSSLFPSYRITQQQIKNSSALKFFIMNLEEDNDIIHWTCNDVLAKALYYLDAPLYSQQVITHVLLNETQTLSANYNNLSVITNTLSNTIKEKKLHNGRKVVDTILTTWEKKHEIYDYAKHVDIFIDINKRSLALQALCEECAETNWQDYSNKVTVNFNKINFSEYKVNDVIYFKTIDVAGNFPEIKYFADWLAHSKSEYLVLLTGDGEYRFRDILLAIKFLKNTNFAAVFGSRNQSRIQYKHSLRAAYGERKLIGVLGFLGSFFITIFLALRYGVILSDPLTGFRVFKRSRLNTLFSSAKIKFKTPIAILKFFIKNQIEIAELPVSYRTFSGFTDPKWRIKRGLRNLLSVIF